MKKEFTLRQLEIMYNIIIELEDEAVTKKEYEEYGYDAFDNEEQEYTRGELRAILKKIESQLPKQEVEVYKKEFQREKYGSFYTQISPRINSVIEKALKNLKTIEIGYYSIESDDFTTRKVDAYYTNATYLIAYCHFRRAIRKFRKSRIIKAKMADNHYHIPKNFDKKKYL